MHVCSLVFTQQTSSSPDRANDTVKEMSKKKSRQTTSIAEVLKQLLIHLIAWEGKASLQQTTQCILHLEVLE